MFTNTKKRFYVSQEAAQHFSDTVQRLSEMVRHLLDMVPCLLKTIYTRERIALHVYNFGWQMFSVVSINCNEFGLGMP